MDRREFLGGAASGLLLPKDMANIDWLAFAQKNEQDTPAPETVRLRPVSDAQVQQIIKDVEELKRWRGIHAGLNWATAGIDYPHPTFMAQLAFFGLGNVRIGEYGPIQIADNSGDDSAGIWWIPQDSTGPWRNSQPNSGIGIRTAVGITGIDVGSLISTGVYTGMQAGTTGVSSEILELSVLGADALVFSTPPLGSEVTATWSVQAVLWNNATGPATPTDGGMWYNPTTDRFKGRQNGATVSFAMEGGPDVIPYASKSAGYTTTANDGFIAVDASGAARTITLITAVGNTGLRYTIKKTDSSANAVTIDGNGSQTIDGVVTIAMTRQYEAITIVSNGANWLIESRY